MKILLVYDLAPNSTKDVAQGLVNGLRSLGHEVFISPLHAYVQHFVGPYGDSRKVPPDAWALFHGVANKVMLGDAALFEPDAVLVVSGWAVAQIAVERIKRLFGCRAALYLTESPYMDERQAEILGAYDVVFCNERISVPILGANHDNVQYLPHSYDPEVHKPTKGTIGPDVYFCATGFTERMAVLAAGDWSGIDLHLMGFWPQAEAHGLAQYVHGETVRNEDLPALYTGSAINLNIHRTTKEWDDGNGVEQYITHAESIGPRVYEVLACGGFLISDHRAEMDGFLQDGRDLIVYRDPKHLTDLVRHYLQRSDERQRIAASGRAAVQGCTFSSRAQQYILPHLQRSE